MQRGSLTCSAFALHGKGLYFSEGSQVKYSSFNEAASFLTEPNGYDFTSLATAQIDPGSVLPLLDVTEDWAELKTLLASKSTKVKRYIWTVIVASSCQGYAHAHTGREFYVALHPLGNEHPAHLVGTVALHDEEPSPKKAKSSSPSSPDDRILFIRANSRGLICVGVYRAVPNETELVRIDASHLAEKLATHRRIALSSLKPEGKRLAVPGAVLYSALNPKVIALIVKDPSATNLQKSPTKSKAGETLLLVDLSAETVDAVKLPESVALMTALTIDISGRVVTVCDAEGDLYCFHRRKRKSFESTGINLDFRKLSWHDHPVTSLGVSPSGDITYSADEKGLLALWAGETETNLCRSVMRDLGAPVIGEMTVPCPHMNKCLNKQLERIRPLVCLHLATNELLVVDTSNFTVKHRYVGVQKVIVPPQENSKMTKRRILMTKIQEPSSWTYSLMNAIASEDSVTLMGTPKSIGFAHNDSATVDLGRIDSFMWKDSNVQVEAGIPIRTRLQWSRQEDHGWNSQWRTQQIAMAEKSVAIAVAEASKYPSERFNWRLNFLMPDSNQFVNVSSFLQSSETTALTHLPLDDQIAFAAGSVEGELAVFVYDPELNTFCDVVRHSLHQTITDISWEKSSRHMTLVLNQSQLKVFECNSEFGLHEIFCSLIAKRGTLRNQRGVKRQAVGDEIVGAVELDNGDIVIASKTSLEVKNQNSLLPLKARSFEDYVINYIFRTQDQKLVLVGSMTSGTQVVWVDPVDLSVLKCSKTIENLTPSQAILLPPRGDKQDQSVFTIDVQSGRIMVF